MQSAKEKASNVAASAMAGMEKAKANVEEKVEKMKAHDQQEKAMAEQRKGERKHEAEVNKEMRKEENAEVRAAAQAGAGNRIISGNTPAEHETGGQIN